MTFIFTLSHTHHPYVPLTSPFPSLLFLHPSLLPSLPPALLHSLLSSLPLFLTHSLSIPLEGAWDGKSEKPPLTSCSSTKHLEYDNIKEHQKVTSGTTLFTYGVQWRHSDTLWVSTHRTLNVIIIILLRLNYHLILFSGIKMGHLSFDGSCCA